MIAPKIYDLLFLTLNKYNKKVKKIAKAQKKPMYSIKITLRKDKPKTINGVVGILKFF